MALGSLLGLVPDLSNKLARVYIIPLNEDGSPSKAPDGLGTKGLPFWPESISDSKGAVWDEKAIPGGSHPIYQWVSGTPRTISFTIVLSRDTQEVDPLTEPEDVYNIDIAGAIAWLRGMIYPLYEGKTVKSPPVLQMVFPGSELGGPELDDLFCIMTQCDVEYQTFFNDGTPRLATVAVSVNEIVQIESGRILFLGRDDFYSGAERFKLDPKPGTS